MDSTVAIVRAMCAACRDLGLPEPAEDRARQVIGLGLAEALSIAVPELAVQQRAAMIERYRDHYLAQDHQIDLFSGMTELLAGLSQAGHRLAVATGKSRQGLNRAFHHSNLGDFFDASRCADECCSKPHPQMLEELMEELDAVPEITLMIGDTTHDLLMARHAGVDAVGVTYGAHPLSRLEECRPLACVHDVAELAAWLARHA